MGYFAPIRQDDYPATDELQCIAVHIPAGDEYKALLAGFIAFLTDVNSYEDPESAQADGIAAVFDTGYAASNWDGCGVPPECQQMNSNLILFPSSSVISSGNLFGWVSDPTSELGGYWAQTPAASGDQFRWDQFMAAGDWLYRWTYFRNTDQGKSTFYVTQDFSTYQLSVNLDFRGALARNQHFDGTFTIPEAGEYFIGMDGTGASSGTSYLRRLQRLELWKLND